MGQRLIIGLLCQISPSLKGYIYIYIYIYIFFFYIVYRLLE